MGANAGKRFWGFLRRLGTVQDRRDRILIKYLDQLPYTYRTLLKYLATVSEDFTVTLNENAYDLYIRIRLEGYAQRDALAATLGTNDSGESGSSLADGYSTRRPTGQNGRLFRYGYNEPAQIHAGNVRRKTNGKIQVHCHGRRKRSPNGPYRVRTEIDTDTRGRRKRRRPGQPEYIDRSCKRGKRQRQPVRKGTGRRLRFDHANSRTGDERRSGSECLDREIGVFGLDISGNEILFCYGWLDGEDSDNVLPATTFEEDADTVHIHDLAVFITNQEAAAVSVQVGVGSFVTTAQMTAYAAPVASYPGRNNDQRNDRRNHGTGSAAPGQRHSVDP